MMHQVYKYFVFDWDDNILHMPTLIHIKYKGISKHISTQKFAKIRNNKNWQLIHNSLDDFRDTGPRGTGSFITDVKIALKNRSYGPSWKTLIDAIRDRHIIMVITARGHSSCYLKEGIRTIIYDQFTSHEIEQMNVDGYLNECRFMGVYSDDFVNQFKIPLSDIKSENAKLIILDYFISEINQKHKKLGSKFTVGFSDDDKVNLKSINNFFSSVNYSNAMGYYSYDTSNPKKLIKTKY